MLNLHLHTKKKMRNPKKRFRKTHKTAVIISP